MDLQNLIPGDPSLIQNIVDCLKAKGIFDEFRHECLADLDTKSSYQNLGQRVDGYTSNFLSNINWHPGLNKNELRNELRRSIELSGILERGADAVVDQVIGDRVHLLRPKISEVVHEYIEEQNELSNNQPMATSNNNTSSSEQVGCITSDSKAKASISDPIADILSFRHPTSKSTTTTTHVNTGGIQLKHADLPKLEKRKEKPIAKTEKSILEISSKNTITAIVSETMPHQEKEKIKKKHDISQDISDEVSIKEFKPEKNKTDYVKSQNNESYIFVEENKANVTATVKSSISEMKNIDKNIQKLSESNTQSYSNSPSKIKNSKKECNKSLDKFVKSKPTKSLKELPSPIKSVSSMKNILEENTGESSKAKFDSSSSKTSELLGQKVTRSSFIKKERNSKHRRHRKKTDKSEKTMSSDKNSEKFQSDYSEDSDIKNLPSSLNKAKQKHQQAKKENSEQHSEKIKKILSGKKGLSDAVEESPKNYKSEKTSENKMLKTMNGQSNVSKEILLSISEEAPDSSVTDMKLQMKENLNPPETLSPSPSFSSLNVLDSKPSSDNKFSCSEEISKESSSDNESALNSSTDNDSFIFKFFLTSSSSEFEGFSEASPEKKENENVSSSSSKEKNLKDFSMLAKMGKETDGTEDHSQKFNKILHDNTRWSGGYGISKNDKLKESTVIEAAKINSCSISFGDISSVSSLSNASKDHLLSNSDEAPPEISSKEKEEQVKGKASCQNSHNTFPPSPLPSSTCPILSDSYIQSSSDSEVNSKKSNDHETALISLADNSNTFNDLFLYSSSSSEFEGFENNSPKKEKIENIFQDMHDSELSVSSVHTSDLSSYDDEISDDGFFCNESHTIGKKKLTLKEAQDFIRKKADLVKQKQNSPSEKKPIAPISLIKKADEESSPSEPIRSLRRERKPNPRYASSEYTSIFNSKKETFITKQSIPSMKSNVYHSSNIESKCDRGLLLKKGKLPNKSSVQSEIYAVHQDEVQKFLQTETRLQNSESFDKKDTSENPGISTIFKKHNESTDVSSNDSLKLSVQNISKLNTNSYILRRKPSVTKSSPGEHPCSQSSGDSSSSEILQNKKPLNSVKQSMTEEENILKHGYFKRSDLAHSIKKDLFSKQGTNKNKDALLQKAIFPKTHERTNTHTQKKRSDGPNESGTSKEPL